MRSLPSAGSFRSMNKRPAREPRALARADSPDEPRAEWNPDLSGARAVSRNPMASARRRDRHTKTRIALVLPLGMLCLSGCAGGAKIHMIPLGSKRISTTSPLIVRIEPDQCYWWINDDDRLCVAMRKASRLPLGNLRGGEFLLSFDLGKPPAGTARNYRVDRRTLRARRDAGYNHRRAASLGGIATVWDFNRKVLHGRFRITTLRQSYLVLTGWRADARVLMIGEFTAVENREKGEAIFARTEEEGMARSPELTGPPPQTASPPKAPPG